MNREDTSFPSGGDRCAAWLYRPAGGGDRVPCVVMAHGFSLTRHDGLPFFAEAFAAAGAAVLVFDHRHLGDSVTATPQRFRIAEQAADWRAAIAHARGLDGVDPTRIVLWGYSFSGGHCVNALADEPGVAAGMILCPFLDGVPRTLDSGPRLIAWILPRAMADRAGRHVRIPVTAPPGGHAAMTLPGEAEGFAAAVPDGSPWRNEIGPGLFLTAALFRPVRRAARVRQPVWVGLGTRDISVSAAAVERFAADASRAQLHRYDADHFEVLYGALPERIAADQVAFLAGCVGV